MEAQKVQFKNKGMYQDSSVSKSSDEFSFNNTNIRITATNDRTLLSVTNEKNPSSEPFYKQYILNGITIEPNQEFYEGEEEITTFTAYASTGVERSIEITYTSPIGNIYTFQIDTDESSSPPEAFDAYIL